MAPFLPLALPLLPPLHAGAPDPTGPLHSDWSLQPTVVIGLLALVAAYLYATRAGRPLGPDDRPATGGQKAAFIGGATTLLVALGPPLDDWSDHYLLSAHMVQHLLLTMLAPPLLLLGTPAWLLRPLLRWRLVDRAGYLLTRPVVAYAIANAVFVVWHLPVLYEAALRREAIHVLEHQLFIATGLLAWWPIVGPLPAWPRLSPPLQCLFLAAQMIPGQIVGAFITLADPGLYAPYDTARRIFGLDLATDQQIAGLLMWVASGAVYLLLITVIFLRWAGREEAADRERLRIEAQARAARTRPAPRGS